MFITTVFGAEIVENAPSQSKIDAFKKTYSNYKISTLVLDTNFSTRETFYIATPNTTVFSVNFVSTKKEVLANLSTGSAVILRADGSTKTVLNGEQIAVNIIAYSFKLGETALLKGVGLQEIPKQMVETGGIVLPAALTVLGSLLMVGLVLRLKRWFLHF